MSILSKLIKLMAASLAGDLKIEPFAEARRTLKTGPARKAFLKKAASNRVDTYWQVSYNRYYLEPISKNGFWFKIKAAASIKPE